jgi:hypothetical protein
MPNVEVRTGYGIGINREWKGFRGRESFSDLIWKRNSQNKNLNKQV